MYDSARLSVVLLFTVCYHELSMVYVTSMLTKGGWLQQRTVLNMQNSIALQPGSCYAAFALTHLAHLIMKMSRILSSGYLFS